MRHLPVTLAIAAAVLHVLNHPGLYYPDTTQFLREGWCVGNRTDYPIAPPAYPLFLDVICQVVPVGARMSVLVALQQLAVIASVWFVQGIVEIAGRPRLAIVLAGIVALYVPLYQYAQTSQTEALFIAFTLAATYWGVKAMTTERDSTAWVAGVWSGLSMAQRTVGVVVPLALLLTAAIAPRRPRARVMLPIAVGCALTISVFIANNWVHHGAPRLVGGTGLHMYNRIAALDRTLPDTDASRDLQTLAARSGMSTEDMLQPNAAWRLHAVLAYEAGLGAEAADDLLRTVALQAHMAHPWTALKNTFASMTLSVARVESTAYLLWGGLRPEVFDEHFAVVQGPWLGYPAFTAMVNELPPHASSAPMGNWVFSLMEWWSSASTLLRGAWVIPAMLLAGLVGLLRRDVVILVSAATAFGALFLAAVGDMPVERYWDPAVPFFVMAVGLSAAQLAEARRRRLGSTDSTRARDLDQAPTPDTRTELTETPLVSVVMPCLNEADTVVACVQEAKSALTDAGLAGEVIVADNGSSDGSQELARSAGARVVHVSARGYGHALMAGIADARGQYVVMGDADQSYDFGETPAIVAKLSEGFDLVQGCRLPSGGGRVMPGAMPLLHRWWGNPMFSVLARWWFKAPIHDVYCGLRGFTKEAYGRLNLQCTGMEFAVEMIVRSSLMRLRVGEVPVTLRPDGRRTHAPHLRTFRDGWRTLRFFLLFSPRWLFLVPGLGLIALGASACLAGYAGLDIGGINLDVHTLLFGALMVIAGYQGVIFAILSKVFAIRARLLPRDVRLTQLGRFFSLERGLVAGTVLVVVGIALLAATIAIWARTDFGSLNYPRSMRVAIPGVLATVLGLQTILFVFFTGVLQLDRRHPGAD